MAKDLNKILSESGVLSSESQEMISEAWNSKLAEAREEIAATLREEFARKFEHDKKIFAESVNRFLDDKIQAELTDFAKDKAELKEAKLKYKASIKEHAIVLDKFLTAKLSEEIKELRGDKVVMKENFKKLENFVLKQLSEEIRGFREDKKALVEQKMLMVTEGKKHLREAKVLFIKRAAKLIDESINKALVKEITQLKEDVTLARKNDFGRRIFEAFAGEYLTSHLNEGSEVKKMQKVVSAKQAELTQITESLTATKKLAESLEVKLAVSKESALRESKLSSLVAPLSKDKQGLMKDMLKTVRTSKLDEAFERYLPVVLDSKAKAIPKTNHLNESKLSTKTGDRPQFIQAGFDNEFNTELAQIKSLAGL